MARRSTKTTPEDDFEERILDIDVVDEMQSSYLQYAYSVIYSRALPDARDGLKPVHRRIIYQMNEMGLRPERGYVKCARVVGEVMGKLHPHGDASIYDALVRMAQDFSMRMPLVDGHGNFGSLGNDDPPAAMRYTESRMAPASLLMTESIEEDTVDFAPNYDGQEREPIALPSAFPNLLVNGASGIAVGMATNMPPHNLGEVIAAARHLIRHPNADLDALMRFVPGPDLPTGGRIVGLDGIRDAYESGRGTFKIRSTTTIENVTARRKGIVVTELPFTVGPEKVISKIKDLVGAKRLQGIADVKDLTDRTHGLRLVIEVKNGFNPEAVLEQLYKLTPMEESFGINNVALVDGQPLTFFHFSGFDPHRPKVLSKHQNRISVTPGSPLAELLAEFAEAMLRNGHATTSPIPYLHNRFASGRPVSGLMRRRALRAARTGESFATGLSDQTEAWFDAPDPDAAEPGLPDLLEKLEEVDLVLVEGFKTHPFPKLEVHRPALGKPPIWPDDPNILAVATDAILPRGARMVLPLNDPAKVADWIAGLLRDGDINGP